METIDVTYYLKAPAQAVWCYIEDFLDIKIWWPSDRDVFIERVDTEGEGIGCIRHIYNRGFPHPISERLDFLDPDGYRWKLSIVGVKPAGIVEYQATGHLSEIDNSHCQMTYHSEFSAEPGRVEEARNFLTACYDMMQQGLEMAALRKATG